MKACLWLLVAMSGFVFTAHAEETTLKGAGATFPAPLYTKWIEAYGKSNPAIKIEYQGVGSGNGIKAISERSVEFGGTDAPMTAEQMKAAPGPVLHLPMAVGPVAVIYNLPGVENLTLNGETLLGIYMGKITKWNDAKIAALNAGVALPEKDITVAERSDGSGTTWIFTNYLSKISKDWQNSVGNAATVKWPVGQGGKGNAGIQEIVSKTEGGIGYVEAAFAKKNKMQVASLINVDGKKVVPSAESAFAAVNYYDAGELPSNLLVSFTNLPGEKAYPIVGCTYVVVYEDLSYLGKPKSEELVKYLKWCIMDGQKISGELEYTPISEAIQKKVLDTIGKIKQ